MKSFVKAITLALFVLVVFAAPGFSGDTIKIGAGGVVSGDLAPYGISAVRGYELAVEDLNAKGGILGKKVELIIGDDVCKPEISVNMAMKLVSDGAQMVVGHVCSGATLAANKIYKDAGLLIVSPASTNDGLTFSGDNPNFFRTISYDGAQAVLMTKIATEKLHVKKVALIHDKGDYGRGQMELVKANFEKMGGVEVVLFEGVTTGAVDYS
ncbi:MAG: ABC transporter substrate-binding protein, partial [Desulfobacteraceae bacterium]|nr:ABC transporter substrate-binding protein [Desulfobacteraceae bacterium]